MDYVFEKIEVPTKHSFIVREIQLAERAPKIHSHKNYELNFIVSGSGRRIVGNNITSFEHNDLVLLGPDLPHCWEILEKDKDKSPSCITIHFYENIIHSDFFNIPEMEVVMELLKEASHGIYFSGKGLKEIRMRLRRLLGLQGLESYIELLNIFNLLLRMEHKEALSETVLYSKDFARDLEQINKVYEYVFINIGKGIKLQEAADIVNMASGSFCRYFKKKTNLTFMEYVKKVRISLAAKMLIETDKSISQICYESGYNNLANFNHYFKTLMKKTPSEYRKMFR
jgi:AraC-like DNA-binding protein